MRSLKHALPIPSDRDTEMIQEVEETESNEAVAVKNNAESSGSTVRDGEAIDTYLTLLIETDEELSKDPTVDKSSPSYNNLLNHRIGMKLNAKVLLSFHSTGSILLPLQEREQHKQEVLLAHDHDVQRT